MRTPGIVLGAMDSGKTTVLVERIAYLLDSGVPADEILVLAVSQQASDDLCGRLAARIDSSAPAVATFDSFAFNLVRNHHGKAGFQRAPRPSEICAVAEAPNLLERNRDLLVTYQLRFPHVLVDQFEKITDWQARLAVALGGTGLFITGDTSFQRVRSRHIGVPTSLQELVASPWFYVIRLKGRYGPALRR